MKKLSYQTYVLLGDGECQAGIVWEGAATAAKYHLANLTALVDSNGVQLDGPVHEVMPLEPWRIDGRPAVGMSSRSTATQSGRWRKRSKWLREIHDRPTVIMAHTTKGKGVSFMENQAYWHGNVPNADQLAQALAELGEVAHG